MPDNETIDWSDSAARCMFADAGVADYAMFMSLPDGLDAEVKYQPLGDHKDKSTGVVARSVARIELGGRRFFLKRAWSGAFDNISAEFAAINKLPEFGLRAPKIAAWRLDAEKREGFILLDELRGFTAVSDILRGKAPEEAIENFESRKERILAEIAAARKRIGEQGYAYLDFVAKHIFVAPGSDELALIDLERFRASRDLPCYFRYPILFWFTERKLRRKLLRSLESEILPRKLLEKIL